MKRYPSHTWLFWLLCLLALPHALYAQEPSYVNFTVNNGLSSSTVYCVFQDSRGYLWFGTNAGVNRYNGYEFTQYGLSDGLPGADIIDVYEDTSGKIWLISSSGYLSYYYREKIYFPRFSGNLKNENLEALIEDEEGRLIVANKNGEVTWIDPGDSSIAKKTRLKTASGQKPSSILKFQKDQRGVIWGETIWGFHYLKGDSFINRDLKQGSPRSRVRSAAIPDSGLMFASTFGVGTISYQGVEHFFEQKHLKPGENDILCFMHHSSGAIWAGTKNGIYVFQKNDLSDEPVHYYKELLVPELLEDREGNIWVCTLGDGILFLPSAEYLNWKKQDGLPNDNISQIRGDAQGNIWAADYKANICRISGKEVKTFPTPTDYYHPTSGMLISSGGRVMVSAVHEILEVKDGRLQQHLLDCKEIAEQDGLYAFLPYTVGIILARYGDLFRGDITEAWDRNRVAKELQRVDNADFKGDSLVLTTWNKGLYLLQGKDKLTELVAEGSWFRTRAADMKVKANGDIYIATSAEGVFILRPDGSRYQLSVKNGLPGDMCRSLFFNGDECWVATNKGACRIIEKGENRFETEVFSYFDGLVSNELNSVYVSPQGEVWVATSAGISKFNPHHLQENRVRPLVQLEKVLTDDSVYFTASHAPVLAYKGSSITFHFLGISYKSRGDIRYEVQLIGAEDSSSGIVTAREMTYTNLPAGNYTFRVWAVDRFGNRSAQPASFSFRVRKPYWQTTVFILGSICLLLLLLVLGFFIIQYIIKSRERKNYEIKRKMNELEVKALRAQMNPHFLFNSLNAIQHLMIKNEREAANLYLSKFASLMRMILQNSKKNEILVSEEIALLKLYLELEALRFEEKLNYSLEVDKDIAIYDTYIPSMVIQPLVENAVKHGLMGKESGGTIKVEFKKYVEGKVKVIVQDDGIGREKANEIKNGSRLYSTSTGLQATTERLKLYSQGEPEENFTFIDLYDEQGQPAGSRIELVLPAIKEE